MEGFVQLARSTANVADLPFPRVHPQVKQWAEVPFRATRVQDGVSPGFGGMLAEYLALDATVGVVATPDMKCRSGAILMLGQHPEG